MCKASDIFFFRCTPTYTRKVFMHTLTYVEEKNRGNFHVNLRKTERQRQRVTERDTYRKREKERERGGGGEGRDLIFIPRY